MSPDFSKMTRSGPGIYSHNHQLHIINAVELCHKIGVEPTNQAQEAVLAGGHARAPGALPEHADDHRRPSGGGEKLKACHQSRSKPWSRSAPS